MNRRILDLDPHSHQRHPIHGDGRIWAETNCYVDVWVELAHALGREPVAALPFTFAIDFEGDQWTFFKFPLRDLDDLFGFDVQELALWRPLAVHVDEQIARGRPVLVELDSFHLPDTAGTAYRMAHVKSTVAAVGIDIEQRLLNYFHNQGFHSLGGEDFDRALRVGNEDPSMLPPYAELVKIRERRPDGRGLVRKSIDLLRRTLEQVPNASPFDAFRTRFEADLAWLLKESLETFHQYSFATLRQFGACYELSATYLRWLGEQGEANVDAPMQDFLAIAEAAKAFQFQLARSMARGKPLDLAPIAMMSERWASGIDSLRRRYD